MPKSSGKRSFLLTLLLLTILVVFRQAASVTTTEQFNLVGSRDFHLSPVDGQLVSMDFLPVGGPDQKTTVSIQSRCRTHQDLRGIPNNATELDLEAEADLNQRITALLSTSNSCFNDGGGGDTFTIRPSHDIDLYVTFNTSGAQTGVWFIATVLLLIRQAIVIRRM